MRTTEFAPSRRAGAGRPARVAALAALLALVLLAAACGSDGDSDSSGGSGAAPSTDPVTVRLGYFPNVTHAPAIVGAESGIIEDTVGDNVTVEYSSFNAGPQAIEAMLSGGLDVTYIGPNPAITAWSQSKAIQIVSGAASGGAYLVVKPSIKSVADLEGKTIATPQLGNTQDVALRAWLKSEGYETDIAGGGEVSIRPQENAQTLDTFKQGLIDGAWVPMPWAERLIKEGNGTVLVDEADLWPNGQYVTTHMIVRKQFLDEHPDVVKQLIAANAASIDLIANNRAEAEALVAQGILNITQKAIAPELVTASFDSIEFTTDPIASSLYRSAEDAHDVGLLDKVDLKGIYDLSLLNEVRTDRQEGPVKDT